ncbi:MAG: hypothetical protein ACTSQ9_07455 [Candidatus Hodarchaeales archaeon]
MISRTIGKLAIILGIIGVIIGFFGGMFLTTSLGSIHIEVETTSDTFHMDAGHTYTLAAIGNDWPMGGGSGMIILHYMGGIATYSYNIGYNFDGDATYKVYVFGEISISESGTYYMEFSEVQRNIYAGDISIELQEPLIQSVLGISNSILTFGGIILIPIGISLMCGKIGDGKYCDDCGSALR